MWSGEAAVKGELECQSLNWEDEEITNMGTTVFQNESRGDGEKYSWTAVWDLEECKGLNMKTDGE